MVPCAYRNGQRRSASCCAGVAVTAIRDVGRARVADLNIMRTVLVLGITLTACGSHPAGRDAGDDLDGNVDGQARCAPDHAGAACVIALYDAAASSCDAETIAKLRSELDARDGLGPLW